MMNSSGVSLIKEAEKIEKTMTKKKKKVAITKEKCKGCNFCIQVCPRGALVPSKDVNKKGLSYVVLEHPEKCNGCGMCVLMCPDQGIDVVLLEE